MASKTMWIVGGAVAVAGVGLLVWKSSTQQKTGPAPSQPPQATIAGVNVNDAISTVSSIANGVNGFISMFTGHK